jgi:hypothetical protein
MLWKTHIRITTEVMDRLGVRLTDEELSALKEGIVAPDKWKDFPHHYGKSHEIREHLNLARSCFLKDDLPAAYSNLGIALHYIQDSFTTYPSFLPKHQEWEEWIEEAHFVTDIMGAIQDSSMSRPMKERSSHLAQELSREVQGRIHTLRIATLNDQEKTKETIASPKVDLNLGFLASYLVSRSVLGPKRSPSLDAQLISVHDRYVDLLRSAEKDASSEIIALVKQRNELAERSVPTNGMIAKLKNWFTSKKISSLDAKVALKKNMYFGREHLVRIADRYYEETRKITWEHDGWYLYYIPPIDIDIIASELLDLKAASTIIRLDRGELKGRLSEMGLPFYIVDGCEIVERAIVDALTT